jgi:hypothetical protein
MCNYVYDVIMCMFLPSFAMTHFRPKRVRSQHESAELAEA